LLHTGREEGGADKREEKQREALIVLGGGKTGKTPCSNGFTLELTRLRRRKATRWRNQKGRELLFLFVRTGGTASTGVRPVMREGTTDNAQP